LIGMQGFDLVLEPAVIALIVAGAAVLLFGHRK